MPNTFDRGLGRAEFLGCCVDIEATRAFLIALEFSLRRIARRSSRVGALLREAGCLLRQFKILVRDGVDLACRGGRVLDSTAHRARLTVDEFSRQVRCCAEPPSAREFALVLDGCGRYRGCFGEALCGFPCCDLTSVNSLRCLELDLCLFEGIGGFSSALRTLPSCGEARNELRALVWAGSNSVEDRLEIDATLFEAITNRAEFVCLGRDLCVDVFVFTERSDLLGK